MLLQCKNVVTQMWLASKLTPNFSRPISAKFGDSSMFLTGEGRDCQWSRWLEVNWQQSHSGSL